MCDLRARSTKWRPSASSCEFAAGSVRDDVNSVPEGRARIVDQSDGLLAGSEAGSAKYTEIHRGSRRPVPPGKLICERSGRYPRTESPDTAVMGLMLGYQKGGWKSAEIH